MCSPVTRAIASACVSADRRVVDHLDGHAQRRAPGALADPGLEHPELALLDRELGVAHVAVVRFEAGEDLHQLVVDRRELALQRGERLGVADAGDDVLALGVHEEVAVGALLRPSPGRG